MPFMKGRGPIRRTLKYLEESRLYLNKNVRVVTVNYNTGQQASRGLREFVFWNLPQLQFKNPTVQIVTFKNMTPSPFIQLYLTNGEKLLVDADSRSRSEIFNHFNNTYCSEKEVGKETENTALFGEGHARQCICEVPGQLPCPGWVVLPKEMRGKYKFQKADS